MRIVSLQYNYYKACQIVATDIMQDKNAHKQNIPIGYLCVRLSLRCVSYKLHNVMHVYYNFYVLCYENLYTQLMAFTATNIIMALISLLLLL